MSLDTPFVPLIEIEQSTQSTASYVTISDLNENHQLLMKKGETIDAHKLIEILGGADKILKHYQSSNNLSHLQEINQFQTFQKQNDANIQSPVLSISSQNSFLHEIFGIDIANKVTKFMYSRLVISILVIEAVIWFTIHTLDELQLVPDYLEIYYIIYSLLFCIKVFIYIILFLIAMNKIITKSILKTFEYHFKMFYGIRYIICGAIAWKGDIIDNFSYIRLFLILLAFGLLDGLKLPLRVKATILIAVSTLWSLTVFRLTFADNEPYIVSLNPWSNSGLKVDLANWATSSLEIITIFAWKQTIFLLFRPKQSTLIKKSVIIVWQNGNDQLIDCNKLIETLGGSNAILQHYLSSECQHQLTTQQLQQINDLLTSKSNDDAILPCPILTVSAENTFLHGMLAPNIANKITNVLYNRILIGIVLSEGVIWFGLNLLNDFKAINVTSSVLWIIYSVIFDIQVFVCISLLLLTMNKTILKMILKTFEYWFKMINGVRHIISAAFIFNGIVDNLSYIRLFLILLAFCSLDALRLPLKVKAIALIVMSLAWTIIAFRLTFLENEPRFVPLNPWSDSELKVDVTTWAASSLRIITIFAWKQTAFAIFRPKESTLIKTSVKIVWS